METLVADFTSRFPFREKCSSEKLSLLAIQEFSPWSIDCHLYCLRVCCDLHWCCGYADCESEAFSWNEMMKKLINFPEPITGPYFQHKDAEMKSIKNTSRIVLIKSCFHSVSRGCRRWRKIDLSEETSRHFCSLNSPRKFLVRNHFSPIFYVVECHVRCSGHKGGFLLVYYRQLAAVKIFLAKMIQ